MQANEHFGHNAIVNKTAISYKANRMIGGSAPSKYLAQLQGHTQVKLTAAEMDAILKSSVIDLALLEGRHFQGVLRGSEGGFAFHR